ncbi:MAG TPA: GtrA family protein [Terracidiphilus sp.]|jgi:putative flippase GtrA|nr:GtrA family protein [Terracidiphilus sp.]
MTQPQQKSVREFSRYLLVGGFNTVFGYSVFALLTWALRGLGPFSYMYAWAIANVIAITAAFLAYKWFVFRTHGNYLAEWIRCFGVYGSGMLFGLVALPIAVAILRRTLHRPELAPYLGVAILTIVTIILSFFGHRNFSFRRDLLAGDATNASKEKVG